MTGFFRKRFLKVYLPVLLVSVIWIPIYYIFVDKNDAELDVLTILYDLF